MKKTNLYIFATFLFAFMSITTQASAQGLGPAYEEGWPIIAVPHNTGVFMFDQLEYSLTEGSRSIEYEATGWYGGDVNRVWLEAEGGQNLDGDKNGELERFDIFYSRLIAPFWDVRGGVGLQSNYGPGPNKERGFAVVGLRGLAPYYFETDVNLRISDEGDVSADVEFEYDMLLTQRLILQPQIETKFALSSDNDFEQGSGLNNIKGALRLRYEVRREFAPYVGVSVDQKFGETADMADDETAFSVLFGVRAWF